MACEPREAPAAVPFDGTEGRERGGNDVAARLEREEEQGMRMSGGQLDLMGCVQRVGGLA
jgi:hypothetical protein